MCDMNHRRVGLDPDGHNCYLSAVEVTALANQDLVFDDDWGVYESVPGADCGTGAGSGAGAGVCHTRERVSSTLARYAVSVRRAVATVAACSQHCQEDSTCRAFAFRYYSTAGAADNCLLAEQGVAELASQGALTTDAAWDLYARYY